MIISTIVHLRQFRKLSIKLGNSSGALVLKVPASTVCEATDITTRITSQDGNKSINVTVKGVTVSYPDANDAAFKLIDNAQTWDVSKAVWVVHLKVQVLRQVIIQL